MVFVFFMMFLTKDFLEKANPFEFPSYHIGAA